MKHTKQLGAFIIERRHCNLYEPVHSPSASAMYDRCVYDKVHQLSEAPWRLLVGLRDFC